MLNCRYVYRDSGRANIPKRHENFANAIGALMWYWILIHLWHEPEHILVILIC